MKSSQVHTNTAEKHGEVHDPNGPPPALVRVIITTDRLNECLSTSSLTLSVSLCYCCIFFFKSYLSTHTNTVPNSVATFLMTTRFCRISDSLLARGYGKLIMHCGHTSLTSQKLSIYSWPKMSCWSALWSGATSI